MTQGVIEYAEAEKIARACHEVNRVYCMSLGDYSQKPWDETEQWQRESVIAGVVFCLQNPETTPEQSHEQWLKARIADGWTWGPLKNVKEKKHPCLLPFGELRSRDQSKDMMFVATVAAVGRALGVGHER